MKSQITRLLPLVVGSAAAGVFASMSPACAILKPSYEVDGFSYKVEPVNTTFRDYYKTGKPINLINGNKNLARKIALAVGSKDSGYMWYVYGSIPYNLELSYFSNSFFQWNGVLEDINRGADGFYEGRTVAIVTAATVPVPWEIDGRTTIPAVGALLLAARWKARRSISSKTRTANPDVAVP